MKINIYADEHIRYRIEGSVSWITLIGGENHTIDVPKSTRIELSSLKTIKHIKITGGVKNVHISKSEIESLDGSFKGTNIIEDVYVRSSVNITNMNQAFEGSSILTFDIPTSNVTNFDKTFKDTYRIEDIQLNTLSAKTMNETFSNSNTKKIDSVLPYSGNNIEKIVMNNNNLKNISGLDLTNADTKSISRDCVFGSNSIIEELDISFNRRRISVRKLYSEVDDNVIDNSMNMEMSIDSYNRDVHNHNDIVIPELNLSSDIENFKLETDNDYKNYKLQSNRRDSNTSDIVEYTGTDNSFNTVNSSLELDIDKKYMLSSNIHSPNDINTDKLGLNIEYDIVNNSLESDLDIRNRLLISNKRDSNNIAVDELDNTYDVIANSIEFDSDIKNMFIPSNKREPTTINTDKLDNSFNEVKTIEIDFDSYSSDIDVLGDGSTVFFMSDDCSSNIGAEVTRLNSFTFGSDFSARYVGKTLKDGSNALCQTNPTEIFINSDIYNSFKTSFSFLFLKTTSFTSVGYGMEQEVFSIKRKADNGTVFMISITTTSSGFNVYVSSMNDGSTTRTNVFSSTSYYFALVDLYMITVTRDEVDDKKFKLFLNKTQISEFTILSSYPSYNDVYVSIQNKTSAISYSTDDRYKRASVAKLISYNRILNQSDVDKLNDIWI